MEPLMSLEGHNIMEDADRSRALLNKFYQQKGYTVVDELKTEQIKQVKQPDENQESESI